LQPTLKLPIPRTAPAIRFAVSDSSKDGRDQADARQLQQRDANRRRERPVRGGEQKRSGQQNWKTNIRGGGPTSETTTRAGHGPRAWIEV